MKSHFSLLLFFVFLFFQIYASVPSGTCRIIPVAATNQSLTVQNSALDNNALIAIWTETNVNAQRWDISVSETNDSYYIKNVYTGKNILPVGNEANAGTAIEQNLSDLSETCKWEFIPVPANVCENAYYICNVASCNAGDTLCLSITNSGSIINDGALLKLEALKNDSMQYWRINQTDSVPNVFTTSMRNEIMIAFKQQYYQKASAGYMLGGAGRWDDGSYWWQSASMMEVILDAYETTGDSQYKDMFQQLYFNFISKNGENWLYNKFNDDVTWMVISCVRAYLLFGVEKYLTLAKNNFSEMYERAYLTECGLLRWLEDNPDGDMTNSCINGPAEVAACYLAQATGDNSYYEKAKELYMNQRDRLFEPSTGRVYDCVLCGVDGTPWNWASTYNQGTYLGAAVMLYNHYGDAFYKQDARNIMQYTIQNLCDGQGIINVCGTGRDKIGFKGILMRYVRRFITDMDETGYIDWLHKNILQGWNNRNSEGVIWTAWRNKTSEDFKAYDESGAMTDDFSGDAFGPSTAVSLAFNSPVNEKSVTKNAYSKIEAENFNYIKTIYTAHDSNSEDETLNLTNIRNGAWAAYYNVDFGNRTASRVMFRYAAIYDGGKIEIRLGNPQGNLVGSFDVTATAGWDDYQYGLCNIQEISGRQNIYLVFSGSGNIININYFRFETDETCEAPAVTSKIGILNASHEVAVGHSLEYVLDEDAETSFSTGLNSDDDFWISYQSPVPVQLKAYAFSGFSTGLQPEDWKMQASNNETDWVDFDTRSGQTVAKSVMNKYEVSTDKYYTFFRFSIDKFKSDDNLDSLFLSEWRLYGTTLPQQDITDSTGVITAECDVAGNLIDNQLPTNFNISKTDFSVQYTASREYAPISYTLTSGNDPDKAPKDWVLYASKDGKFWMIADRRENQCFDDNSQTGVYSCDVQDTYSYFKLHVTENNGNTSETEIAEWQLFGDVRKGVDFYNDITSGKGVLSSSSNQNESELGRLVDNNGKTVFSMSLSGENWIQYQTKFPTRLLGYSIMVGENKKCNPGTWMLKGSTDGERWVSLSSRKNIDFEKTYQQNNYDISNTGKYTYFRLIIDSVADRDTDKVEIAELELHGNSISSTSVTSGSEGSLSAQFESSVDNENYPNLIDNSPTTKYLLAGRHHFWVQYEVSEPIILQQYSLTSANDYPERDPVAWNLYASNDGESWILLDSVYGISFLYRFETEYFPCVSAKEYRFFKLEVLESKASEMTQFAEWQLFASESGSGVYVPYENKNYLLANYPNPFTDKTNIVCTVPAGTGSIHLKVYTTTGILVDSQLWPAQAGKNRLVWTNSHALSGIFFYTVSAFSSGKIIQQQTGKLMIEK
ncbi:MAG: glycoside hydrolase family 76 protein [Paludibacter sp.]|nr:glycoside hydrolase family 76 protein [Paludibacter sp.]